MSRLLKELANRETERLRVQSLAEQGVSPTVRCLIFKGGQTTGVSFFARHLVQEYIAKFPALFFDGAQASEDLAQSIVNFFQRYSLRSRLQLALARHGGKGLILKALSVVLPKIGTQLLPAGAAPWLPPLPSLSFSHFPSLPIEILARFLCGRLWRPDQVLVVVDNAQDAVTDLRELLDGLHAPLYQNIRFVLFFVQRPTSALTYDQWKSRLSSTGISIAEADFARPTGHLVEALAFLRKREIGEQKAAEIADAAGGNVFSILSALEGRPASLPFDSIAKIERITSTERYLLAMLWVARQPLLESDLQLLLASSPTVYYSGPQALQQSLRKLKTLGLLASTRNETNDSVLRLSSTSSPELQAVSADASLLLATANEVYEYFKKVAQSSPRHSKSYVSRLLYRLAALVDPDRRSIYAQQVLKLALQQGSLERGREYIDEAIQSRPQTVEDIYVRVAFFVSTQDYASAKEIFDAVSREVWEPYRLLRLLHAVAVNRLRMHAESQREFDALLDDASLPEEQVVSVSFYLINFLHEGDYQAALKFFESWRNSLREARNFPYLLRTGASVFLWGESASYEHAREILVAAQDIFREQKDWYGYFTTQANLGTLFAYEGNHRKALELFEEAYGELAVFGTQHLEEVGFNLVVTLAFLGRLEDALRRGENMLTFFEFGNFPQLQLLSLVAVLLVLLERATEARERLDQLEAAAARASLSEARFHAYANALLLSRYLNVERDSAAELYFRAYTSGFEPGLAQLELLKILVDGGHLSPQMLLENYSFDYHQYWSQNPLDFLPAHALSKLAIPDHMHQEVPEPNA